MRLKRFKKRVADKNSKSLQKVITKVGAGVAFICCTIYASYANSGQKYLYKPNNENKNEKEPIVEYSDNSVKASNTPLTSTAEMDNPIRPGFTLVGLQINRAYGYRDYLQLKERFLGALEEKETSNVHEPKVSFL